MSSNPLLTARESKAVTRVAQGLLVEQVAKELHIVTAQWAHLRGRCLIPSGPQEYGTQYRLRDGQIELHPVADPGGLDKRRADIGLPPQREQATLLERRHLAGPGPVATASIGPAQVIGERTAA